MTARLASLLLLTGLTGMLACDPGTDGGSDGVADSDTAGEESESSDSFEGVDLFACALSSPCVTVSAHIDPEPFEGLVCAAELIAAGEAAALFGEEVPGPDQHEWDHIVVLLGDGTAVQQIRYREVPSDPWDLREQKLCTVVVDDELEAACAEDPVGAACQWDMLWGGLTDCVVVEDYTCGDIQAVLGA